MLNFLVSSLHIPQMVKESLNTILSLAMILIWSRKDNSDTYRYFGNPIYTYSLKQGIEDGFLAPYRVHRVVPSIDATGWRPTKGLLFIHSSLSYRALMPVTGLLVLFQSLLMARWFRKKAVEEAEALIKAAYKKIFENLKSCQQLPLNKITMSRRLLQIQQEQKCCGRI